MIGRAIESVIAQTYASWELLVVDDGSTDNTKEVVEEYNDSRIRYIYQQNAERSAARNNGIDNAKGEYVCFIDSDDYYLDTRLKDLFEVIESHNFSINFFFTDLLFYLKMDRFLKERNTFLNIITYKNIYYTTLLGVRKFVLRKSCFSKKI
ncbi:MAG: glycosyltransferase family 2 protein [Sphingobacteriales bacterium JAD_PAG50586_3]|nr:MAG: glycosyltransferase family 2 protein [Sphingobacteriales bacterium JAD_PAG50586_3]